MSAGTACDGTAPEATGARPKKADQPGNPGNGHGDGGPDRRWIDRDDLRSLGRRDHELPRPERLQGDAEVEPEDREGCQTGEHPRDRLGGQRPEQDLPVGREVFAEFARDLGRQLVAAIGTRLARAVLHEGVCHLRRCACDVVT